MTPPNISVVHSSPDFPTYLKGQAPITIGMSATASPGLQLQPETLQVISASPIPVTPTAAFLLNNAILAWKALGVTGSALQVRVGELQRRIAGGYVLWSTAGVSPNNADNSAALSSLPTGVLVLADTPGTINILNPWQLQSRLWVVSDPSDVIAYNLTGPPSFTVAAIGQAALSISGTSYALLDDIYLFGLNFLCPNVNTETYSVISFNANHVRVLYLQATNYSSLCFFVGANVELAYWNCHTTGDIAAGTFGGPGIRMMGNAPNNGAIFVASDPTWPQVPALPPGSPPGNHASVWVHDNYVEAYDGVYQISPAHINWGAGVDSIDVIMENSTCVVQSAPPTAGETGPLVLVGSTTGGLGGAPFAYNVSNACFRGLTGNAVGVPLLIENGNNPGHAWTNLQFLNITCNCSTMSTPSACIRILTNPGTSAGGSINGCNIDSCHFIQPPRACYELFGDPATVNLSNATLNNCIFDAATAAASNTPAVLLHGFCANVTITNNTLCAQKYGFEIGGNTLVGGGSSGSQINTITVTNNVAGQANGGLINAGIAFALENVSAATISNNHVVKGAGATHTGLQTIVGTSPAGTRNCSITNNNLEGMALTSLGSPVTQPLTDAQSNTISGNT